MAQDESRSMWKRATVYTVSFTVNGSVKDFYVERSDYDRLEPGEEGILVYSGSRFISFEKWLHVYETLFFPAQKKGNVTIHSL